MDSHERNKILMGLGFALLAVFGINELSKAIYAVPESETKAYVVANVVEETAAPADAGGGAPVEEAAPDWGTVLASADAAAGEQIMGKCAQCHSWDKGGANKVGPNLYGIVGNHHAHLGDGFAYSKAMLEKSGDTWDYTALYHFIANPKAAIPGTKMGFAGLPKSQDRINVIAYLRSQNDSPPPIPAPAPAGAAPAAPAPGAAPAKPEDGAAKPPEGGAPAAPPTTPATPPATPGAPPEPAATPPADQPATPKPPDGGATPASPPADQPATPPAATPNAKPATPPPADKPADQPATPPAKPPGG